MSGTLVTLGAGLLGGSTLPWLAKTIWRLVTGEAKADREQSRIESLEELIDGLRRALDKVPVREDALANALSVIIFALKHLEDVSPIVGDAIDQAIIILRSARDRLTRINDSGRPQP